MPTIAERLEIADTIALLRYDPWGYVRFAYPWGLDGALKDSLGPRDWQIDVLQTIGKHLQGPQRHTPLQLAVSSGHGIGKSALIAMIINWAMSTCVDARVVVTANTEAQLRTKTWPEISKWTGLSINADWWQVTNTTIAAREDGHDRLWRTDSIPWSENNTEAFAGLHNKGKRIVVVLDEGSAIPNVIWEVIEGALTDEGTEIIFLAFGNPTKNTGRFRECFGRLKHRWVTRQIDSRAVDGTNKEQIQKWIDDYGLDSDFCRVRIRGEFPRAGSAQFIAGDVVADARTRDVGDQSRAYKILSVDVARFGDDQTVIGYRQGMLARIIDKIRGWDTMQVGRQVIMRICEERPRSCVIDGDGIGGAVADYVRLYLPEVWRDRKLPTDRPGQLPSWFRIEEFHGGGESGDKFMYYNQRAYCWGRMRDWLITGQIPDDPELEADLTGPEYFHSNKNQIQIEKKEDMKSRGLASPDCADMLMMTFGVTPIPKTRQEALEEDIRNTLDPMEKHFKRLRETDRRERARQPLQYWE